MSNVRRSSDGRALRPVIVSPERLQWLAETFGGMAASAMHLAGAGVSAWKAQRIETVAIINAKAAWRAALMLPESSFLGLQWTGHVYAGSCSCYRCTGRTPSRQEGGR